VVSMWVIRDIHSKGSKRDRQTESSVVNRRRVRAIKPVSRVRPGCHHVITSSIITSSIRSRSRRGRPKLRGSLARLMMEKKRKFEQPHPAFRSLFFKRTETYEQRNAEKARLRERNQKLELYHPQWPVSCRPSLAFRAADAGDEEGDPPCFKVPIRIFESCHQSDHRGSRVDLIDG
jgi:hypothetical protein